MKEKFSVTITRPIRGKVPIKPGQLVEMSTEGGKIVLVPLVKDPASRLAELIGDLDREFLRKEAEKIIVEEAERSLAEKSRSR